MGNQRSGNHLVEYLSMKRFTSWLGNRSGISFVSNPARAKRSRSQFRPRLESLENRVALDGDGVIINEVPLTTLWGVDEDDGELFSIADYTQIGSGPAAAGFVSYGDLKYDIDDEGTFVDIGVGLESFAVNSDGIAYFTVNRPLERTGSNDLKPPILVSIDLSTITTAGPNVVTIVGEIPLSPKKGTISGLAFDPETGDLYALQRVGKANDPDKLVKISTVDASIITTVGTMRGKLDGKKVAVDTGEDLNFDSSGRLFVTDDKDDQLYEVDTTNGKILSIVVANERTGTGLPSIFVGAIAWDSFRGQFVGNDKPSGNFLTIPGDPADNTLLGKLPGLKEVEDLEFEPFFNGGGGGEESARIAPTNSSSGNVSAAQIASAQINASVVDEIMQKVGSSRKGRRG